MYDLQSTERAGFCADATSRTARPDFEIRINKFELPFRTDRYATPAISADISPHYQHPDHVVAGSG
jgi:hypothetical protein